MKKIRLKTDEWIYIVFLACFVVFWIGYKTVIQPIQREDHAVPAFIEKTEAPIAVNPPSTLTPERVVIPIAPKENQVQALKMSEDQMRRLRAAGQDPNGPISSISTPKSVKK